MPEVLRLAAFTDDPAGGNPAGVVFTDVALPDEEMQRIAADVGYSETAFLTPATGGAGMTDADGRRRHYRVRYFSPKNEVPFCGHATIAAGVAVAERFPAVADVVFATNTAVVPVTIERSASGSVATLTSPPASQRDVPDAVLDAALACFGWDRSVLDPALPAAVVSAGAHHLLLPLARRDDLRSLAYDFEALEALMLAEDWTTVHVVWRESAERYHARDPFPVGGVVEDPATGAAAAAFGGYLRARHELPASGTFEIVQGEDLGRRSVLTVVAPADEPGVQVRGTAVPITADAPGGGGDLAVLAH